MPPSAEQALVVAPEPRLSLTGSRLAEYFRFACERQLRLRMSPEEAAGVRVTARPGASLLAAAGHAWERRKLRQLQRRLGPDRVLAAGWSPSGEPNRLAAERVVEALRSPGRVEVLVQPELRLPDPEGFCRRHGIDPQRVALAVAVPDLVRVRRLRDGSVRFQVVDVKASAEGRAAHFAQVAFYTLVLEELCRQEGILTGRVDRRWGRIWARDGRGPRRFPLAAYRHHVREVLRRDLARVAASTPEEAAWHLSPRCGGCPFLAHCRDQADRGDDLARVVGITPAARRVLHARGIRTVKELDLRSLKKDTFQGCHALESQAERLRQRTQAVRYGKVYEVDTRTHLMPAHEDVRVILTAEGDPVTGRCFALGMRVESASRLEGVSPLGIWLAGEGSRAGERALLDSLLASVERVMAAVAGLRRASLHFYLYDRAEMELLRSLLLRHLAEADARPAIARLLRFLSPRSLTAQPDVVRSTPGTIVAEVVAALFALPVPYAYDLAAVSDRLRPARGDWAYAPRPGYAWPFSSQVAFERIHDVWRRSSGDGSGTDSPERVAEEIRATVASKLKAIDSVVRAVRERAARKEKLQMRKEPFSPREEGAALPDPTLEALRVFAELESAAEAVGTRALHVLPAAERARRFECIRGMSLVERRDDGTLLFEFDPACRDVKFRAGEFNLVLTNDDDRSLLETDRQPWRRRRLMMELVGVDVSGELPRVTLSPSGDLAKAEAEGEIDLDRLCVLDRAPSDFNTGRVLGTLRALAEGRGESRAILGLLRGEAPDGWSPVYSPPEEVLARTTLNADQARAWRAVFERPLSVIWGPPGTGKTYLLAWILIGLAAAARREGRPCRVLVCAATHRAIVNVMARLSAELSAAGVELPLRAVKLRGSGSEADAELEGGAVELVSDPRLPGLLDEAASGAPLVAGSTVWSLWKQMRAASPDDAPVQPWFDVVVVDEASQMKVGEALIALSALRPGGQVVLCGDDRQLAPVVRGRYGDEAGTLFGSVFAHAAAHFPRLTLRESRRMNAALVEYPRSAFYPGLVSRVPDRRIRCVDALPADPGDALLRDLFLRPDDAVVLCAYRGVRATARNPFEAHLAARLARLARETLLDPATGEPYAPAAFVAEGMAVLSPHRAQNSAILAEMRRLGIPSDSLPVVDTVERMQGNERETILVSYAVADREYAEAEAEFLLDPNRFNVSITRARAKLIVLVSEEVLEARPTDDAVLSGSMAIKGYRSHCRDAVRRVELPSPDGRTVSATLHYRRL